MRKRKNNNRYFQSIENSTNNNTHSPPARINVFKTKTNNFLSKLDESTKSLAYFSKLSYPLYKNAKQSEKSFDIITSYAANTYKGTVRNYNEDRISVIVNVKQNNYQNLKKKENIKLSFFAIYDGHAGNKCCEYLKHNLHLLIFESNFFPEEPIKAIQQAFDKCEKNFFQTHQSKNKNNENKKNIDIEGKMEDEFDKLWDEYDDDDELNEEPEEKNNENEENNPNYNYEYNNYYNHDNKYYGNKNYSYGPKKYSRKRKNNYYQKENEGYSNKNNQKYYFHEYSKINISNNYFMNTNKNYMKSEYNDNKNSYKEQNNIDKEEEDIKKPMFTNSKLQNNGNPEGNFIKINVDLNEQKRHINLINIGEVNINDKINNSILTMNKKEYDDKKN